MKALARTEADRTEYEGLVESTVRKLVTSMEQDKGIAYAIPYPQVGCLWSRPVTGKCFDFGFEL